MITTSPPRSSKSSFVRLHGLLLILLPIGTAIGHVTFAQSAPLQVRIQSSQDQIRLEWNATPGKQYSVQSATNLNPPVWSNLATQIAVTGTNASAVELLRPSETERYYRIAELSGGGSTGGGLPQGGSKTPAGTSSSAVAATALVQPVSPIETNGVARVRYLAHAGSFSVLEEISGPHVTQLDELTNINHPIQEFVLQLNHFYITHPNGFGENINISISLPAGFVFDVQGFKSIQLDAWGTYPEVSATNYANRFPMDWSLNAIDFERDAITSFSSSNLTLSLLTDRILIPPNNQARSSHANLKALRFLLDPPIRVENLGKIDGRSPKMQVTINGMVFDIGLCFTLNPDFHGRQQFVRPSDEAGGTANLLTGEHAFSTPLFEGQGHGINVGGVLFYSSLKASWDRAALERASYTNYTHLPLGPGWAYPYGTRVLADKLLKWNQGVSTEGPGGLTVITPDGGYGFFGYVNVPNSFVTNNGVRYSEFYSGRLPLSTIGWAQFINPVIIELPTGGYLLFEKAAEIDGFTRLQFDATGRLVRVEPHGGAAPLTIAYEGNKQIVTDSSGRITRCDLGAEDKLVRIDDPAGGIWLFSYAMGGALIKVTEQGTGYGWEFAYDNEHYLLTERKLPHGFILQSDYDTASASTNRFFWGAIRSTRWKESPGTSARAITYRRRFNPNSTTPDQVSISTPSGRNVFHYDLSDVELAMSFVSGGRGDVMISDEIEGGGGTLRFRNLETSTDNIYGGLGYQNRNPLGDIRSTHFRGSHLISLGREDGSRYERTFALPLGQPVTYHAPTKETNWRSRIVEQYRYANPGTALERLREIYGPGQGPEDPMAKKTIYNYDAANRLESIIDADGHTTQYIYESAPNAGQIRTEIRCVGEPPPFTTTERNPYRWNRTFDGLGRLTSLTDPEKNATSYVYDSAGRLVQVLGPTNISGALEIPTTHFEYDGDLVSEVVEKASANQELSYTYSYDERGRLVEEQEPGPESGAAVVRWQYEYDSDGNRVKTTSPNGAVTTDTFDNRQRLVRSVGPEGDTSEFDYDLLDSVSEMRRVAGNEVRRWTVLRRDKLGRIAELELPVVTQGGVTGRPKITTAYDENDNLLQERYTFAGSTLTTEKQYGLFDEMVREIIDMGGRQEFVEAFVPDHYGRIIQSQGPIMRANASPGVAYVRPQTNRTAPTLANYSFNCFDAIEQITDGSSDQRLKLGFDLRGLVSQVAVPDPSRPQAVRASADTLGYGMRLDASGEVAAISDVFNNNSTFERDLLGRETAIEDPLGTEWKTEYNPQGEISRTSVELDGAESITQTDYDSLGQPQTLDAPGNDAQGSGFEYDRAGRLVKMINPEGNAVQFVYNGFGEAIREIKASGAVIELARDGLGRVTSTTTIRPSGQIDSRVTTEYDRFGRVFATEDAHRRVEQDLDNLGRVLEKRTLIKTNNFTERLTYRWGQYGNLVAMEDQEGSRTEYTWDNEDNLLKIRLVSPTAETQEVEFRHDRVGKLTGYDFKTGGASVLAATLARDKKGQVTALHYTGPAKGLPRAEYTYDAREQRTEAIYRHKDLKVNYGYDRRGFLTSEVWSQLSTGTNVYEDLITYDPAGNRTRREQNGAPTIYSYSAAFKLAAEQRQSLVRIPPMLIQVSADSVFDDTFKATLANDLKSPDSAQPEAGWRSGTNTAEHWIVFDFGAARPISAVDISFPTVRGGIEGFRLERWDDTSSSFQLVRPTRILQGVFQPSGLIATSNHTARAVLAVPPLTSRWRVLVPAGGAGRDPQSGVSWADVMINEVAFYQLVSETISPEFDRDGRLVRDGAFSYSYDVAGRLVALTGPGVNKTWTITPEGLRGSETDHLTGRTRYFGHSGANIYAEYDENGKSVLKHLSALGIDTQLGFYELDSAGRGSFRWLVREGPGTIAQVLDAQGALLDERMLNAWGEDLITPTRVSANPYGFAGSREEPGAGLYYNRARMYDPRTGRFTSPDPRGFFSGPNLYAYAGNNPILYRDPEGEFVQALFGAAIGFGVDLGLQLYQNGGDFSQVSVGQLAFSTALGAATGGLASFARTTAAGVARAAVASRAAQATAGAARGVQVSQTTQRLATAARATLGLQAAVGAYHGKDALIYGLQQGDPVYISMGVAAIWGLRHAYAGGPSRGIPPRSARGAAQAMKDRTAPGAAGMPAPRTAVHFTDAAGQTGIQASRYLNGPYSVWAFASGQVPRTRAAVVAKSLLRPSRTTHQVTVNAAGLRPPAIRGPFSLFQRLSGVLRTPGPGTYQIESGRFYPRRLYDPETGRLRRMTPAELSRGGAGHDIALEFIGYGGLTAAALTAYTVLKDD